MNFSQTNENSLHLVIPSDGELHDTTLAFLNECGLTIRRPSARQYTAYIPSLPGIEVLFQRTADITQKVEEASAEIGITGLDRLLEYRTDPELAVPLIDDLGFGGCDFVLAVPNAWLDVTSLEDLSDLALEFHEKGNQLRIATKYPKLLRQHLFDRGINYFTVVPASGTLEAAPVAGYADLIADLTATGTTLRENRLKTLDGGTILRSQACVIGNPGALRSSNQRMLLCRHFLELIEANLQGYPYYRLTGNVIGESAESVSSTILAKPDISGLRGPTLSRVYNINNESWYSVSLLIRKDQLMEAVDHLRSCGALDISASQVNYLFENKSSAYETLSARDNYQKPSAGSQ